jgi:hypothetical protein
MRIVTQETLKVGSPARASRNPEDDVIGLPAVTDGFQDSFLLGFRCDEGDTVGVYARA